MSDTVIRVENLSKRYVLGGRANGTARYDTFRDALVRAVKRPFARLRSTIHNPPSTTHDSDFWALRDVSFEVQRGEVLGIIGRNGAGKSTLLKILSRITEPTSGRVAVKGRVASLLEVGTGFHPELSGRENIFLNGVILGMTRAEVKAHFDEIVAFAEVEKFLDTPVKHYSSGMYVRLAFAVAAHLDPEILIVDEVLAVGDEAFQRKCLGKLQEVSHADGRTVLFVSHNADAVARLCSRVLLLHHGKSVESGDPDSTLAAYRKLSPLLINKFSPFVVTPGVTLTSIDLDPPVLTSGQPAALSFRLNLASGLGLQHFCLIINTAHGQRIAILDPRNAGWLLPSSAAGKWLLRVNFGALCLVKGEYRLSLFAGNGASAKDFDEVARLEVVEDIEEAANPDRYPSQHRGLFEMAFHTQLVQS